jgi:protein TonB
MSSVARGSSGGYGQGDRGGGEGGGRGRGRRLLERWKQYPTAARRLNLQGVAVLQFTIGAGGTIEGSRISRSSGHDLLDQAAQETLRRVGRFSPLPVELGRQQLTVEIPLAYRLR